MAYARTTAHRNAGLRAQIETFLARLVDGAGAYMTARRRSAEFERLNAMSDAELAKLGLTRADISRHVYRAQH